MSATQTPVRPVAVSLATRPPRRHWPFYLAAFLVLAMLGGSAYVVYRTPVLGLQQLEVTAGSDDLSGAVSDSVEQAAAIAIGTPLITIDLDALRRRVLAVPQIATAQVSRHWPHSLVISVTQRQPVAVTMANGSLYLLDSTGYPYLKVAKAQVPAGLLTIALATPHPGDPSTLAALAVIAAVKAPIRAQVGSVSARSAYDVELNLLDGRTILWGSPDNSAKKMQVLPAVLAQPGHTYDVSDPEIVTVGP